MRASVSVSLEGGAVSEARRWGDDDRGWLSGEEGGGVGGLVLVSVGKTLRWFKRESIMAVNDVPELFSRPWMVTLMMPIDCISSLFRSLLLGFNLE